MTTSFTSQKTFIAAICGVVAIFISILGSVLLHQQQQYQSTHLASLSYLDAALHELTTFTPKRLTSDEPSFQRFRELNTAVISHFQRLKYGNDESGVAAISVGDDLAMTTLLNDGEKLLSGFGKLIQSRQDINQYRQYNKRLVSEADALVQATEAIAAASEQQPLSLDQRKALYDLTLIAKSQQYLTRRSVLSIETETAALTSDSKANQDKILSLIQSLTASNTQLANPVLRRMVVNITDQMQQHIDTVFLLSKASDDYRTLEKLLREFRSSIKSFLASVDNTGSALSGGSYMARLTVTLGVLAACLSFFFTGIWTKEDRSSGNTTSPTSRNADAKQRQAVDAITTNQTATENTQQRKQVITEKNQLIHDIQPIIDGVFYVDANEHAETTGEIAKAFNGARRSIVKRLQLIQQEVTRLQHLQQPQDNNTSDQKEPTQTGSPAGTGSKPQHTTHNLSAIFDVKACVDVTFETQTKIEHIRRLQRVETTNPVAAQTKASQAKEIDQQITALMECQDHLRVRLRDLQLLIDKHLTHLPLSIEKDEQAEISPHLPTHSPVDLERLSRLINSFQLTEVPRSRQQRKATTRPVV